MAEERCEHCGAKAVQHSGLCRECWAAETDAEPGDYGP